MTKNKGKKVDLVKERCILVSFGAGYYNWKRRDRAAEREYAESKGVARDTYETKKNIFKGTDQLLASAKSLVNESRAYHYELTMPWQHGKTSILANALVPTYRQKITEFKQRMDALNDQIRAEWKGMLTAAKNALGPGFNSNDYPPVDKVIASNYIRVQYSPVATGDDIRSTLDGSDTVLDEIRKEINAETMEAFDSCHRALWERIYDVINVANKNLQKNNSGDGRFRTEWYDNLMALLPILDDLNLHDDPRISEIKDMAEKLVEYEPEDLKDDINVREAVAEESQKVFDKVSGIFAGFGG